MRPICLPSDPSVTYDGEVAKATGWGRIENNGSPTNLMKVDVKVIDIQTCMNSFGSVVEYVYLTCLFEFLSISRYQLHSHLRHWGGCL